MPKIRIKRAKKWNTFDNDALLGSHNIADNKVFRVTRLRLYAEGGAGDYYLADRSGTIDHVMVTGTIAPGDSTFFGAEDNPLYEVVGTFSVRGRGTVAAGTYVVSFEGVEL